MDPNNTSKSINQRNNTFLAEDNSISIAKSFSDPSVSCFNKMTFLILGVSSLIGWNAMLASFEYFNTQFTEQNVFLYFPLFYAFTNCFFGFFIPYLVEKLSLLQLIIIALCSLMVLFIAFPMIANLLADNTGFWLACVCCFIMGIINCTAQNSMIGMSAQVGGSLNQLFWVATGLSGFVMVSTNIICNAVMQGYLFESTLVFFSLGAVVCLTTVYLTYTYVKNKDKDDRESLIKNSQILNNEDEDQKALKNEDLHNSSIQPVKADEDKPKLTTWQKVKIAMQHERSIPVYIFITYLQTYMLFPNFTLTKPKFDSEFLYKDSNLWGKLFLNETFQIGDVAGRMFGRLDFLQKLLPTQIFVLLRFGLFASSFLLIHYNDDVPDWSFFINIFLLAFSNGVATQILMGLGPKCGNGDLVVTQSIGFVNAFFLKAGIALAMFLAIPLNEINI